jgi:hypothetical protein
MRGVATNVALKIVTPPQEIRTLILAEMLKKLSAHTRRYG